MTSQLSQPSKSISARDMGKNGAVPKRAAQYRRYPVMSRAVCMVRRGLDQKQRKGIRYLGGPIADIKGGPAPPRLMQPRARRWRAESRGQSAREWPRTHAI